MSKGLLVEANTPAGAGQELTLPMRAVERNNVNGSTLFRLLPCGIPATLSTYSQESPMANATPVEIERKFLVDRQAFFQAQPEAKGQAISQGYWAPERLPFFFTEMVSALRSVGKTGHLAALEAGGPEQLEMRVRQKGERYWVTFKSREQLPTGGVAEYEEELDANLAGSFLDQVDFLLSKTRYELPLGQNLVLEVDVFDHLDGLVMAEVEIPALDTVLPDLPAWVGEEVTGNPAYFNRTLAERGRQAYEGWFQQEVEQALAEADDPTTEWVSHDEVKKSRDGWRAR